MKGDKVSLTNGSILPFKITVIEVKEVESTAGKKIKN